MKKMAGEIAAKWAKEDLKYARDAVYGVNALTRFRFRAWNGETMEYGGFSVHATGKVEPLAGLSRVAPESPVMQATGIYDDNGREIYEGDIVRRFSGQPWEQDHAISWVGEKAGFCLMLDGEEHLSLDHNRNSLVVVGNVYQPPEVFVEVS